MIASENTGFTVLCQMVRRITSFCSGSSSTLSDRELEDAAAPIIRQRFQAWVESHGLFIATSQAPDLSLEQASSSSHRFCIIIDAEAVQNVLRFPVPVPQGSPDWDDHLGVKVLDVECNANSDEYEPPYQEGWLGRDEMRGIDAAARDGQIKRASDHEVNDFQSVEARGRDSEVKEAAGPSLDARSAAEIKTVDSLMADTQTDADLWRVLHERVISRVLALQLDTSEKPTEDLDKARTPIKKAKGKKSKTLPVTAAATPAAELATTPSKATPVPSAQDLHLLTQTFPIHLLNFTKRCSSSFPGSSLPSNLLPYIKSLGPTTFAMAATTSLYNHHMSQLYYQHLDLPSIIATLEEMDQQVYDFDTATYNLLGKILHRANEARLGHLGPGTQAIWGSERMRSALKGIAEWKAKVLVQMEARALHVARSQPALENRRDKSLAEWGGWFEVANPNNTTPPPSPGKHRGRRAQRQAAHYITEECERLFCGTLEAVFLVEKGTGLSEPLVMDAHNEEQRSRKTGPRHDYAVKASGPAGSVTDWLEVYDYHGDGVRFRGFVAESPKQRAMFVFFDKNVVAGQDLKPGLTALLELASSDGVDCDQLIVCVDRTADETAAKDLTKDLGWVGFELTILDDWSGQKCTLSDRWLFLGMDV
ncbi:hypothetical protein B0A48_17881 [Cryoendolithus antarcticus]|uniref:Mtf2-like C-terminal domain-containing protein n=1 Tax=Cryoendolithus antarcticus TaxID=1507870 RepID=A0A1V8SB55_9PEZI|nr:hypothetical protein B0A48_17881 [Cryoendolithus antarcticus]